MTEHADGVIELRSALPVPADQRWFWAQRWQEREREVDEHVAAGRGAVHESTDDFIVEMTWSFAGPDGRATFELVTVDDELRCRWSGRRSRRLQGSVVLRRITESLFD